MSPDFEKTGGEGPRGLYGSFSEFHPDEHIYMQMRPMQILPVASDIFIIRPNVLEYRAWKKLPEMRRNADGKPAATRVTIRPTISFVAEKQPSEQQVAKMHYQSHEQCLIASPVKTYVTFEASSPLS